MRVMLVDDSMTMRRIIKNIITREGITEIIEAENGREALAAVSKNMPIDIIFLDWNMPEMDGISFLKAFRQDSTYQKVKVIMCTSESEKDRVLDAIKAGAQGYLVKPITPEALKQKLA